VGARDRSRAWRERADRSHPAPGHPPARHLRAIYELEQLRVSPFYAAIAAAPLRFRLGRFALSALELHWGATLAPPGGVGRFRLGFARVSMEIAP
jgi:hypothetical protein